MRRLGPVRCVLLAALLAASVAGAAGQGGPDLAVTGYVRSITTLHDLGFDPPTLPGVPERARAFHGEVLRVKWVVEAGRWRLDLHNRAQVRVASEAGVEPVLGFGIGATPERLVDLRTDLLARDRVQAWHDVDRLSLIVRTSRADLTLGRQPITWGTSTLFPVADVWATFGPFEQDTEEKPGIDAVRALLYTAGGSEIDAVVAYRGSIDDPSAGVRTTISLPTGELWFGAGKSWRQLLAMGGVTRMGDRSRWRAETVLPFALDGRALQSPRLTLGADRITGRSILSVEYHHNGIGTRDPERYARVAADPRVARGETYFLGRHFLGALATWSPDPDTRANLALSALVNLTDPSAVLGPSLTYDVGQAARIALGGLVSAGRRPGFTLNPPTLVTRSEFGLYGHALFTTISIYF